MDSTERKKKLSEIEEILKSFMGTDKRYDGLSACYFTPHCFSSDNQGIHCTYSGKDESVVEDLLGYLDIPAMMNGLMVESVRSSSNGYLHVFVYDDDRFHADNLRKLNIMNTEEILKKNR